eukprot:PhM_4_TR12869/c0_g1_i1/m.29013/K19054/FXN; frataxin
MQRMFFLSHRGCLSSFANGRATMQRRMYCMSGFTNKDYNTKADATLEMLSDHASDWENNYPDIVTDVAFSSGVLEIETTNAGKWVLNKQAPKLQIWLSSPKSGPSHYSHDDKTDTWVCDKTEQNMLHVLEKEFTEVLQKPVKFD